jgi:diacylglycerol kinase (ATP)
MQMGSENENIFRHIQNAVIYSCALMMPIGIWIGETAVQWALLIGSSLLVLITELLNSAVEKVVDRIGTEHHILSKQAKDLGSAAAAVSMLAALMVWGLITYERFMG